MSSEAGVRARSRKRIETRPYDAADYLVTASDVAHFLNAALELDDPAFFQKALGTAARARGMQEIARGTGTTRAGLYKALCERGNPEFGTVLRVLRALGLRLRLGARGGKGARAPARAAVRARQRKIGA